MSELTAPECQRLAKLCSLTLRSEPGYPPWYSSDDYTVDASEWHPDTDGGQCFMVLAQLIKRSGYVVRMISGPEYSSAVLGELPASWIEEEDALRIAICRAALAWLDSRKGETRGDWHPDSGDPKRLRAEMDIASKGLVHGEVKVCPNCEGKGEYS